MARRADYKPRARAAHRGQGQRELPDGFGIVQHCRCGAWRALIAPPAAWQLRGATALWSDWSAPCSVPSPAPARDEPAR